MRLLITFLALAWVPSALFAQSTSTNQRPLSLREALELAVQHNLGIQIERYNPQLSLYSLKGQYGAYDPSFNVSGQHDHSESGSQILGGSFIVAGSKSDDDNISSSLSGLSPWGTTYTLQGSSRNTYGISSGKDFETSSASTSIALTQPLLKNFLIDGTRLNIKVAKNRLKYSELGFRQKVMNIVATTEQTYYDLLSAHGSVRNYQKALELATRLVDENRKRVEVGALAPLDVQDAESQAATSLADLIAASNTVAKAEHALKYLITDQYPDWAELLIVPTEPVPTTPADVPRYFYNRQDSWGKALTSRPDILQARLDVEQAGIQLKYTKNQLLPELDLFATYGYNGSGVEFSGALGDLSSTDRPYYTYGGRLTVPLGNVSARNNYKQSKVSQQQKVLLLKQTEEQVMVLIDDAIKEADSAYQQVQARSTALDFTAAALDAEQKKLESGKSTTYTVLQKQRDLTSAKASQIQAMATYYKALSSFSLQEGTILEKHNIDIEKGTP